MPLEGRKTPPYGEQTSCFLSNTFSVGESAFRAREGCGGEEEGRKTPPYMISTGPQIRITREIDA
jgi:hypothetical protein